MDELMHELSASSFCGEEKMGRMMEDENCHLYVARSEGRIVACGCLCVAHTPERTLGFVESVVVKSDCRGRHLGRRIMEHLINEAKRLGVQRLHLTSRPSRVAANALYQSLGFEQHETNCYKMDI